MTVEPYGAGTPNVLPCIGTIEYDYADDGGAWELLVDDECAAVIEVFCGVGFKYECEKWITLHGYELAAANPVVAIELADFLDGEMNDFGRWQEFVDAQGEWEYPVPDPEGA